MNPGVIVLASLRDKYLVFLAPDFYKRICNFC